jgi:hypothetical protein
MKERPCQVSVQLGGLGGCFTDSNSPEMANATRETSELKIKTTTTSNTTGNQMMLLQLIESLSAIL